MRHYKIPKWTKGFYPGAIWDFFSDEEKTIYLTFDDGPHPQLTVEVLDILDEFDAKATFFCLGENVQKHPEILQDIFERGHRLGNHGMKHLNGLQTANLKYMENALEAEELIPSKLYRPPYGKINGTQYKKLTEAGFKVIFWTVMAYDFDQELSSEKRIEKMKEYTKPGSIFVFHDNEKSAINLKHDLPILLKYWKGNDYTFKMVFNE